MHLRIKIICIPFSRNPDKLEGDKWVLGTDAFDHPTPPDYQFQHLLSLICRRGFWERPLHWESVNRNCYFCSQVCPCQFVVWNTEVWDFAPGTWNFGLEKLGIGGWLTPCVAHCGISNTGTIQRKKKIDKRISYNIFNGFKVCLISNISISNWCTSFVISVCVVEMLASHPSFCLTAKE